MFHIHGVWTRTTGIGLLPPSFLSIYLIHSFLFFHSVFAQKTIYFTLLFWYVSLFWFGLVLVLVLVSLDAGLVSVSVDCPGCLLVRVGGGLAGVLRERGHKRYVWIGRMRRVVCYVVVVVVWIMSLFMKNLMHLYL